MGLLLWHYNTFTAVSLFEISIHVHGDPPVGHQEVVLPLKVPQGAQRWCHDVLDQKQNFSSMISSNDATCTVQEFPTQLDRGNNCSERVKQQVL